MDDIFIKYKELIKEKIKKLPKKRKDMRKDEDLKESANLYKKEKK